MYAPTKRPSWKEEEETDEFRLRFSRGGMKREAAAAVGINQGFFIGGGGRAIYPSSWWRKNGEEEEKEGFSGMRYWSEIAWQHHFEK